MKKIINYLMATILLAALVLAGCGATGESAEVGAEDVTVSAEHAGDGVQADEPQGSTVDIENNMLQTDSESIGQIEGNESDTDGKGQEAAVEKPTVYNSFPTIYADFPDPDIIRVGENYYMVSTTMNMCPGAPIMKSTDLVHWQLVNYVYDTFEEDDITNLENGQDMYGRGSWAASLKYDEATGLYYVAFSSNNHGFYIFTTDDIEAGEWQKHSIRENFHDPALFLEDGRLYVLSAGGGTCRIQELKLNDTAGTVEKIGSATPLFTGNNWALWEGAHAYKIGDYYYVFIIASPTDRWMRTQLCYRSKELKSGSWEEKVIYQNGLGSVDAGLAQGGVVQTQFGDWYGFMFQDMGTVGRVPSIVAVQWENDWPMMGTYDVSGEFNNNGSVYGIRIALPDSGLANAFVENDEFEYQEGEDLKKVWQWNHNPKEGFFSVTDAPGYLRLTTDRVADNVCYAHNSLTQRAFGPTSRSEVKILTDNMKPGDYAGICAVADHYAMVGVMCDEKGDRYLFQANSEFKTAFDEPNEVMSEKLEEGTEVYLKISYQFKTEESAEFFYSLDGENWTSIGNKQSLAFSTATTFMGTRTWLFNYATIEAGGYVDFDYYRVMK